MNTAEKRRYVKELVTSVAATVEANVDKMPPNWTAAQLREYVAEKFNQARLPLSRRDRAKYDQEIVSLNL